MKLIVSSLEYNNVKEITFGKQITGFFKKSIWNYADVVLILENGEEIIARYGIDRIKIISD